MCYCLLLSETSENSFSVDLAMKIFLSMVKTILELNLDIKVSHIKYLLTREMNDESILKLWESM